MKTLRESLTYYFRTEGWSSKLMPLIVVSLLYVLAQFLLPLFSSLDTEGLGIGKSYTNQVINESIRTEIGLFSVLGILLLLVSVAIYAVVVTLYSYENTKAALENKEPKSILQISFSENLNRFGRMIGAGLVIAIISFVIFLPVICITMLFLGMILSVAGSEDTGLFLAFLLVCPLAIALFIVYLAWYLLFAVPSIVRVIEEDRVSASTEFMDNFKFGWRNKAIFARLLIILIFSAIAGFIIAFSNSLLGVLLESTDLDIVYVPIYFLYLTSLTGFTVYLGTIVQAKFQAEIYKRAKANSPIVTD